MAPNNALGNPSAFAMRARNEGEAAVCEAAAPAKEDVRTSTADGFGAGMISKEEVASRGTGSAVRTPLEEFEARPRDELRCIWTCVMFLTRLPCPGWCDHHPGYLMRGMAYFPFVGALIGVWAASIFDAAVHLWSPLVAAAVSSAGTLWLTGCFHEDGLCDTLDGFGGGWTKAQIMKIMRDSRNGSYATMGGCMWVVAKCAAIAHVHTSKGYAGAAIIVAQCAARASSAPLIFSYDYVVDDEDAKGEYYNWFGECRRLIGPVRVLAAEATAAAVALVMLPTDAALRALVAVAVATPVAGCYGKSVLGGVMGDFLGATICVLELLVYLAVSADLSWASTLALARMSVILALPQVYGAWRKRYEANSKEE